MKLGTARCDQCGHEQQHSLDDELPSGWFTIQHAITRHGRGRCYEVCSHACGAVLLIAHRERLEALAGRQRQMARAAAVSYGTGWVPSGTVYVPTAVDTAS